MDMAMIRPYLSLSWNTEDTFWARTLLWTVWIVTILFLIRNYAAPFVLRRISSHIRVRSVSLRSIRGIYFRKGHRIWRVDRIGLSYRTASGITIVIQGLHLEIVEPEDGTLPPAMVRKSSRRLALSHLSPSPMAHALWSVVSKIFGVLEPLFRPIIRSISVTCLRIVIRMLPILTHMLHFDLDSAVISFAASPQTKLHIKGAALHTSLEFSNLDDTSFAQSEAAAAGSKIPPRSFTAWKSRLTNSFGRTWDKTWGKAQGNASISLTVKEIGGYTCQEGFESQAQNFISLPVPTVLSGSLQFSPKRGSIEPHSLKVSLDIGLVSVTLDQLPAILKLFKNVERHIAEPSSPEPFSDDETISSPIMDPLLLSPKSENGLLSPSPSDAGILSPKSSFSSLSPRSPVSPFINALRSAASRARSRAPPPRKKLVLDKRPYLLSILQSVDISMATMKLTACRTNALYERDTYELTMRGMSLGGRLGSSGTTSLHHRHFGKEAVRDDIIDADAYTFNVFMQDATVDRTETSSTHLRLVALSAIHVETLISGWPAPLLVPSQFLTGDPNAALLAIRMQLASLELTERIDALHLALAKQPRSDDKVDTISPKKPIPFTMPRFVFECELKNFCGRLICPDSDGRDALELRSAGFYAKAESSFTTLAHVVKSLAPEDVPVECKLQVALTSAPMFLRVRSGYTSDPRRRRISRFGSSESDILGESVISVDSIEIHGEGRVAGVMGDEESGLALIDPNTRFMDVYCSSEAICVELWHPKVVSVFANLLASMPQTTQADSRRETNRRLLDRLPVGLATKAAIGRLVIFSAAPELEPRENGDMMRGIALRTGISSQYCAILPGQTQGFRHLTARSLTRHKLYLPEEPILEAVAAARTSGITRQLHAFLRLSTWHTGLRSTSATLFSLDDPHIADADDPSLQHREFIRIPRLRVDFALSGRRNNGAAYLAIKDICSTSIHAPYIRGNFQVEHIYSLLLLLHSLRIASPSGGAAEKTVNFSNGTVAYEINAEIRTIQILCKLRTQRFIIRVNSVTGRVPSERSAELHWNDLFVWVPVPLKVNRWNYEHGEKWEELARIRNWTVSTPPRPEALAIAANGDSIRLRIPFGYILADLIFDISVVVKCLKHLVKMTSDGYISEMPSPAAEAPKSVPNITVRIHNLSFEAANDPFESSLGLIWRAGFHARKQRQDREDAFDAKAAVIEAAETFAYHGESEPDSDYHFNANHSVSVEEARRRLHLVHSVDWMLRLKEQREQRSRREQFILKPFLGSPTSKGALGVPNLVQISPPDGAPPLFRVMIMGLVLNVTKPSFPADKLPDFLFEEGSGLPTDTEYSLLIPMHVRFTVGSLRISLRDYPLPLFEVPSNNQHGPTLAFNSDIVIAEEMGDAKSIDWIPFPVVDSRDHAPSPRPMVISVPKTIMPVKTYAKADIRVTANSPTSFAWGQSYGAATQDLTRVLDTLTTPPQDSSPPLGFWDKIRLVFHWRIKATFTSEVRLHFKGTRDPYKISGVGAGFAMCWRGTPVLSIGYSNKDNELMQMTSNNMLIVIPRLLRDNLLNGECGPAVHTDKESTERLGYRKICAKFASGVRFGVGFALERTCGQECTKCTGTTFERQCRFFTFKPHYGVKTEIKTRVPKIATVEDSYNSFRSDFIHLSISLTSKVRLLGVEPDPSSVHLSPRVFAHFWSWWSLFDSALSLPIRQGNYYPAKVLTPKLSRHLATIKYRLSVFRLFISHVYIDDSRESWVDGITPFVGVKAMVEEFQADMHQRDQESIVPGKEPDSIKVVRHKPFYAAEVILVGMDLRTLLAIFQEPLKKKVPVASTEQSSNYRTRNLDLPQISSTSSWFDIQDYSDIDWDHSILPKLHLLPIAACPRFTYIKRNNNSVHAAIANTKFGNEDTHTCLLGGESSVPRVQMSLAETRLEELRSALSKARRIDDVLIQAHGKSAHAHFVKTKPNTEEVSSLEKKIDLLSDYITHLREMDTTSQTRDSDHDNIYHMPSEQVSAEEWADFENVYQIHSPKLFLTNAIRDLLLQYYQLSRSWRGLEYHMATRAVKFIKDQAAASIAAVESVEPDKPQQPVNSAQAAATALRRMIYGDSNAPNPVPEQQLPLATVDFDPLDGWSEGVSLRKSHFVLLLKPQIVLRRDEESSVCILAAVRAKLSTYDITDDSNFEDPISGKVMTRNYMFLNGLQTFSPAGTVHPKDGCVPLEVLIDYRCESHEFDRLVPQTDATFHYDRFNRLRLGNNVTSTGQHGAEEVTHAHGHLRTETDFIQAHVPRFTVSASDRHFQAISDIVTGLLLFSDAGRKTHMSKLETLLFSYDFTDLASAATVVADLQHRLRNAKDTYRDAAKRFKEVRYEGGFELLQLRAHIFLLSDELNLIFEGIKLAQSRGDDRADQKSALLLQASSSEIAWQMLDEHRDLMAKLAVRNINYTWLSREDSSTVNTLAIGDLQAFDGSPNAVWAEILSKHNEPANHMMAKKALFLLANWTVLAPVGGISIFEDFELNLHPIRLQVDAKLGSRIMEYVWPARKNRALPSAATGTASNPPSRPPSRNGPSRPPSRASIEHDRTRRDSTEHLVPPSPVRLKSSRSYTDISAAHDLTPYAKNRTRTVDGQSSHKLGLDVADKSSKKKEDAPSKAITRKAGDAAEMKTRSSQKTFIHVKISSLNLLLSIMKEESFDLRDARIRTRDLEFRNETWSFEELVNQFIPTEMNWRGWVKMAFAQPLVPVLPVARELFSKTKWIASKGVAQLDHQAKVIRGKESDPDATPTKLKRTRTASPKRRLRIKSLAKGAAPPPLPLGDNPPMHILNQDIVTEPEDDSIAPPQSQTDSSSSKSGPDASHPLESSRPSRSRLRSLLSIQRPKTAMS